VLIFLHMTRLQPMFFFYLSCCIELLHMTGNSQLKISVLKDNDAIEKPKGLWDNRLGIYNLVGNDNYCGTCGATNASDCDGMQS